VTLSLLVALASLKGAGASTVTVHYSGHGDSGGIESVVADNGVAVSAATADVVSTWALKHAIPNYSWEINAGAIGSVAIDLATFQATVEHTNYWESNEDTPGHTRQLTPPAPVAEEMRRLWALGASTASVHCWPVTQTQRNVPAVAVIGWVEVRRKQFTDADLGRINRETYPLLFAWVDGEVADIRGGDAPASVSVRFSTRAPFTTTATWTEEQYSREAQPTTQVSVP
jgi:hypothetical protein